MAWRPGILHRDKPYLSVSCAGPSSTSDMLGMTRDGVKRLCLPHRPCLQWRQGLCRGRRVPAAPGTRSPCAGGQAAAFNGGALVLRWGGACGRLQPWRQYSRGSTAIQPRRKAKGRAAARLQPRPRSVLRGALSTPAPRLPPKWASRR
jgi:hypothetical protein